MCGEQGQCVEATVLFDNGSDRSYVSSKFVKKVRPKWVCSAPVSYSAFGNKTTRGHVCNIYDLCINKDRTGIGHSLQAVEITTICPTLFRQSVPLHFVNKLGLPLGDDCLTDRNATVDILVGLDHYWKIFAP